MMTQVDRTERGVVERLFFTKGYGFIRDATGELRFFHARWLSDGTVFETLTVGREVEYRPVDLPPGSPHNGRRAHDVRGILKENL
jgi:cold shock CspA family protein